jgi:uncharacterized protein (DUF342 family)
MNRDKRNTSGDDTERDARFLTRLEEQLDEIEMDEIVSGYTDEELEEKGFVGDKPLDVSRRTHRYGTEREHLVFEDGVEFDRLPDGTAFEDIAVEEVAYLNDVEAGALIATRSVDEQTNLEAGPNVRRGVVDDRERYVAMVRGKVVLIGTTLCLFPSDVDCLVDIVVTPDKMHALLSCRRGFGRGRALSVEMVEKELARLHISHGIRHEAIGTAVEEANASGVRIHEVEVARGTEPVPGEDGRPEYTFDSREREYDFRILPDGRIDYKNTRNIIMADEGQLLARLVKPRAGVPGIDVYDKTVPAPSGVPASLYAGQGVRSSEDGRELYAEKNGSVVLNGSILEVVDTYVVDGDVDYSSGNIRFNGNVLINGTVREGFEVEAEGDIIVAMCVERARLEAGRDVIVRGGVQGKGKGLIAAGRDIRAGYAQNARLEAQGNIYIDSYAINCYIYSSRYLYMREKQGVLIGGETYAQRGVDVKTLGTENGIRTIVEAGTDYLVRRTIGELEEVIRFCDENIRKIEISLQGVRRMIRSGTSLPAAKAALVKKVLAKKQELEGRRTRVTVKRGDLEKRLHEQDICNVKVSLVCHPDVVVRIRGAQMPLHRPREAVRFYEDRGEGMVKTGPY